MNVVFWGIKPSSLRGAQGAPPLHQVYDGKRILVRKIANCPVLFFVWIGMDVVEIEREDQYHRLKPLSPAKDG